MRFALASAALAASLSVAAPHTALAAATYHLAPQTRAVKFGTFNPVALTDYGLAAGTLATSNGYDGYFSEGTFWSDDNFCPGSGSPGLTQVTGISRDSALTYTVGNCYGTAYGFLYDQSSNVKSIVQYPGSVSNAVSGVNLGGLVVGSWGPGAVPVHGFYLVGSIYVSFDVPRSSSTQAVGISSQNTIFGDYTKTSGPAAGFLMSESGTYTTISYPGQTNTYLTGLNGANQASGYYVNAANATQAFVWNNGTYQVPPIPTNLVSYAMGVNESGDVAGWYLAPDNITHGFVWNLATNALITINAPSGDIDLQVAALNNTHAQVTGTYINAKGKTVAFIGTCKGKSCF